MQDFMRMDPYKKPSGRIILIHCRYATEVGQEKEIRPHSGTTMKHFWGKRSGEKKSAPEEPLLWNQEKCRPHSNHHSDDCRDHPESDQPVSQSFKTQTNVSCEDPPELSDALYGDYRRSHPHVFPVRKQNPNGKRPRARSRSGKTFRSFH